MGVGGPGAGLVRRRDGVLWRDLPSSLLVLAPDDAVVRLTGAGRLLWLVLEEPATVVELEELFSDDALVGPDPDVVAHVTSYLDQLQELGLIEVAP